MTNNKTILTKDYTINSLNINTNRKLGLFGLLQLLQDITGDHAEKLGFGYEESKERGFFWVLVREKLRMNRWPNWHDVVTVKTWTKPIFGIYAVREYEIFINDEKIGDCSTTWMILDSETRRPKKIENSDNLFRPNTDYALDYTAERISVPDDMERISSFKVKISDLDMNNHVNNIKYTQWILDSIPFDYHKKFMIKEYEINFSNETFLEDKIRTFSNIGKLQTDEQHEVFFQGIRAEDSKSVFFAKLVVGNFK